MHLQWVGQACFYVESQDGRSILIDPFQRVVGLQRGEFPADVVVFTHRHIDHFDPTALPAGAEVIAGEGEHEAAGFRFLGVQAFHDPHEGLKSGEVTLFRFEVDGFSIVHLSDLGERLDDVSVAKLRGADILLFPAGEHTTISIEESIELIQRLQPKLAIPMAYHLPGLLMPAASREKVERMLPNHGNAPLLGLAPGTKLPDGIGVLMLDPLNVSLSPAADSSAGGERV